MIDAWEIGVNIEINDDILPGIARLASEFDKVQAAVDAINVSLTRTGGVLTDLTGQATAFASAFGRAASAAKSIQNALSESRVPSPVEASGAAPVVVGPGMPGPAAVSGEPSGIAIPVGQNVSVAPEPEVFGPHAPNVIIPSGPHGTVSPGPEVFGPEPPNVIIPAGNGAGGEPPNLEPPIRREQFGPTGNTLTTIPGEPYFSGDEGNATFRHSNYRPNWTFGPEEQTEAPQEMPPESPDEPFIPGPDRPTIYVGPKPERENKERHADPFEAYFTADMVYHGVKGLIAKPFEEAASVDQKMAILEANGLTTAQARQAYDQAAEMQRNPQYRTLTIDDMLGMFQAAYLQTGNVKEAENMLPVLANASTVLQAIGVGSASDQMFDMLRAGDLAGLLNEKEKNGAPDLTKLKEFIQLFTAIQLATGGEAIPTKQMVRLFQNAGPSLMGMDEKGMAMTMLLALSLGQQKAGTGINQMYKELVGGRMSIANEKFLESIGLLDKNKVIKGSSHGGYVGMEAGALKDETLFMQNPVEWFAKEIGGEYAHDTPEQREKLIHRIYATAGTAQGARVISDSIFQNNMILRYLLRTMGLPDLPAMAAKFNNTPTGTLTAAQSAGNAVIVTISNDTMKYFMPMLNWFTNTANDVSKFAQKHPDETAKIATATAGVATVAAAHIWNKLGIIGSDMAGSAMRFAGRIFEPVVIAALSLEAAKYLSSHAAPFPEKWVKYLPPIDQIEYKNEKGLGTWSSPSDISKPIVDAIHAQTQQMTSAIRNQAAPSMPTGTTGYNQQHSAPSPGQALPHNW